MTKTSAFIIITAILLASINTFASVETPYSRGFILAVDTRDRRECEMAKARIEGLTTSDVSNICKQDGRNPFSIAIITVPLQEFEYMSEVSPISSRTQPVAISNPQLGTLHILAKSKETDNYFRVMAKKQQASITIFRMEDFGEMDFRRERYLLFAFIMKSNSTQGTSKKIASSVAKRLVFNRGSIDLNETEYRKQATKAANIMDVINGAIHETMDTDRASIGLFFPPKGCREKNPCPKDGGYGLGLSIVIHF
ncbi:hypothetical protein [Bdellovibrio bacteriovorus]|uniref:hypothetical protein n=1 Tax=Bdellovibrio bacteriovorus TaxID=959 RepID=UPI0035A873B2